ncbi:MAG: site-specific DNA-methyltransferase [Terriglobia bacterium]
MSKQGRNQAEKEPVDNISSSRYISHMTFNGVYRPPQIVAKYAGPQGILFRADALDLLANICDKSIDVVFVDPPFNLGKDYKVAEFDDTMGIEMYRGWCRTWILELIRVLRPGGAFFLYHLPAWLMDFGAWLNVSHLLEYKSWIALKMKGSFPAHGRIHPAHYGLLYYVKGGATPTFNVVRAKSPKCRTCGELIRDYGGYKQKYDKYRDKDGNTWVQISDFWEDTRPARRQEKFHDKKINELPIQIPERAILMASKPGDVVLDCFAGSGSTLHAAQHHGRFWIGGEFGEPIAALRRIKTFFGAAETDAPASRLMDCFTSKFKASVIVPYTRGIVRPISTVTVLSKTSLSPDKYAGKSKTF